MSETSKVSENSPIVHANPWHQLRRYTAARIAQGRAGNSLPTEALLSFQLDHARAQDAVHLPLNTRRLCEQLAALPTVGRYTIGAPQQLHSQARDRREYLQRPDLGRRLNQASQQTLGEIGARAAHAYDLALVIADGLSSQAVQHHTVPLLQALVTTLQTSSHIWELAPTTLVCQGRVAIGDEIGERLNARCVVLLIGERPGLSSPDSLGIYLTWQPHPGRSDAERNCISNVRPEGLGYREAASRLLYLLEESRRLELSGVNLKDRTKTDVAEIHDGAKNFLLPR